MANTLDTVTMPVANTTDKAMSLDAAEFIREPNVGSNWNTIRIGVLIAAETDLSGNLPGTPDFVFGMCEGSGGRYSTNTAAFVGASINGGLLTTWTFNQNTNDPYYSGAHTVRPRTKVGTTAAGTSASGVVSSLVINSTAGNKRRHAFFVEITKGTPNYTFKTIAPASTTYVTGCLTSADFFNLARSSTSLIGQSASGITFNTNTPAALAYTEGTGLTHVNLYWNMTGTKLQVFEVTAYKMS